MRHFTIKSIVHVLMVAVLVAPTSQSLAYEGFGEATLGGEGQPVYHVTNLDDSGPGSLRDALSQGSRYVVFDVGGVINLSAKLYVKGPYVTVDGSSAPSPVTLKGGYGLYIRGDDGAHNVIVQSIRVRDSARDGIQISGGTHDIVIDHVSISGAGDGSIDITEGCYNVTVSWSILAGPASGKNMLIKYDNPHSITLHHNLFTEATSRNPQIRLVAGDDPTGVPATETTVDMRNNLIWDWGGGSGTVVRYGPWVNVVDNFYSSNGGDAADALIVCHGPECTSNDDPASASRVYADGNISADGINLDARGNESTPFPAPFVDTQDACGAASQVLSDGGVRPVDIIDQQYLSLISLFPCPDETAPIPPTAVVSASPTSGVAPLEVMFDGTGSYDSDGTIVSYAWNFGDGTTGSGAAVSHTYDTDGTFTATLTVTDDLGATSSDTVAIVVDPDPNGLNAPSNLGFIVSGMAVTLIWTDNSSNEEGFYVERGSKIKGKVQFVRLGEVGPDATSYSEDVSEDGTYRYRVQAFNLTTGQVSNYSNEVQVKVGGGPGGGGGKGKKK